MSRIETAEVLSVARQTRGYVLLHVERREGKCQACYDLAMGAPPVVGDLVVIGSEPIEVIPERPLPVIGVMFRRSPPPDGGAVKLLGSPLPQRRHVLEEDEAFARLLASPPDLSGRVVVIAPTPRLALPAAFAASRGRGSSAGERVSLIFDDCGTLSPYLYDDLIEAREQEFITSVVTCGHAFGGDLEVLNPYTALLAALPYLQCPVAVVTAGGEGAFPSQPMAARCMQLVFFAHIAAQWQANVVFAPSLHLSDPARSDYPVAALTHQFLENVPFPLFVPLPALPPDQMQIVRASLEGRPWASRHLLRLVETDRALAAWSSCRDETSSLRAGLDDEGYRRAALAAGLLAIQLLD